MHGLIANQLRLFAIARQDRAAWTKALKDSGADLGEMPPALDRIYPDEAIVSVVVALAASRGMDTNSLLEDFGAFLAPALLRVYEPLIRQEWRTLDVIEHVEERIHTVVRMRDPKAAPPYLSARKITNDMVEVTYTSPRRLCALGEGISRGLAAQYGERVVITQPVCMHRGDPKCIIRVQLER